MLLDRPVSGGEPLRVPFLCFLSLKYYNMKLAASEKLTEITRIFANSRWEMLLKVIAQLLGNAQMTDTRWANCSY
jgi:hypothetical protein